MKKVFFFLATLLTLVSVGCKKDSPVISVLTAEESLLRKMIALKNAEGGVTIASYLGYNKKTKNYQVDATFKAGQIYDDVKVGDVSLKPYKPGNGLVSNQYIPDENIAPMQLSKLFGRKVSVSLDNQGVQLRDANSGSIDTPLEMDLLIDDGIGGGSGSGGSSSGSYVSRNVPLTWNADPSNSDVYILIMFEPERALNANYRTTGRVEKFYKVRDNGSFTIPSSDFNGIPNGAFADIVVARGTTAIIGGSTNGSGSTSIMSFSSATVVASPSGGNAGGGGSCGGNCLYIL